MIATMRKPRSKPKAAPHVSAVWHKLLALIPGYDCFKTATRGDWFDQGAADQAIAFFEECLTHIEGELAGKSFHLERWQKAVIGCLFGWKKTNRKGRTVRRYREALLFVPRKNGKTPLAAGIANYVMCCDGEQGAQGFLFAGAVDQAALAFRHMKGQILNEPELSSRTIVYGGTAGTQKRISYTETDGYISVESADDQTQHGGNTHLAIIDELHVQKSRDLVDTVHTSFASENRSQPLLVMITTSDFDRPSICNEIHDYACKVRDGIIDDAAFLPVIYEADPDDDWKDPKTWAKANPNLGVSVSREYLERECKRAQESPAYENTFKRLHLNIRTEQDVRIIPMDAWRACGDPKLGNNAEALQKFKDRICFGGLDLASREDLASFTLAFPPIGDEKEITWLSWSWCPENKIGVRAKRRIPYDVWSRQGWLTATPGDSIDHRAIRAGIVDVGKLVKIQSIGYDPRDATEIVQNLQDQDGFTLVLVKQGFPTMSSPTKELISLIKASAKARMFRHNNNPILTWAASNMAVHFQGKIPQGMEIEDSLDKVPIMPSKQSSADKIDPLVAGVIAMGQMMMRKDTTSVYATRGPVMI